MAKIESNGTFSSLAIFMILISVLATIFNFLLLVILYRTKRENTLSIKLITIMSTLDFITGISRCCSFLIRLLLGNNIVLESSWYCRIFGFCTFCIPCLSLVFITVLALERFQVLCRSSKLNINYTALIVAIVCIIILIPNIIIMLNSSYTTDQSKTYCLPLGSNATLISKMMFEYLVIVSYFVTVICYLYIVLCYSDNTRFGSTRRFVWLRAFSIIFAYSVCFAPVIIKKICSLFIETPLTSVLRTIIPICVVGITAVNPFLILVLYRPFYKEIIMCFKKKSIVESTIELRTENENG